MGRVADEPRNEAGTGEAVYLGSIQMPHSQAEPEDPDAMVQGLLREISELRAEVRALRTFETLAVGCAETIVQRSERLRKVP